jgi:hypothetical protein
MRDASLLRITISDDVTAATCIDRLTAANKTGAMAWLFQLNEQAVGWLLVASECPSGTVLLL